MSDLKFISVKDTNSDLGWFHTTYTRKTWKGIPLTKWQQQKTTYFSTLKALCTFMSVYNIDNRRNNVFIWKIELEEA